MVRRVWGRQNGEREGRTGPYREGGSAPFRQRLDPPVVGCDLELDLRAMVVEASCMRRNGDVRRGVWRQRISRRAVSCASVVAGSSNWTGTAGL